MPHILEVKELGIEFSEDKKKQVRAEGISFCVDEGETVCLVGESGCGKSITSLAIMGLLGKGGRVCGGEILFRGQNLLTLSRRELDQIRGKDLSMIFQDPLSSLNPVFTIGRQVRESLTSHQKLDKAEAEKRGIELLERVGLRDARAVMKKYPYQLSGGMRQRVMIAMALAVGPGLLIADEPTTALDVTIQAQIIRLLKKLKEEEESALLLITHDMGVVAQMADRVLVMYAGQIVEEAPVRELFANPRHPYTKALLAAAPSVRNPRQGRLASIEGVVPEDYGTLTGCRFRSRCPFQTEECGDSQELCVIGEGEERPETAVHRVRCRRAKEVDKNEE